MPRPIDCDSMPAPAAPPPAVEPGGAIIILGRGRGGPPSGPRGPTPIPCAMPPAADPAIPPIEPDDPCIGGPRGAVMPAGRCEGGRGACGPTESPPCGRGSDGPRPGPDGAPPAPYGMPAALACGLGAPSRGAPGAPCGDASPDQPCCDGAGGRPAGRGPAPADAAALPVGPASCCNRFTRDGAPPPSPPAPLPPA